MRRDVPEIANHSPHLLIEWSRWHVPLTADEVVRHLRDGDPPIAALAEGEHGLRIAVWTLRDDEHRIVAKRDPRDPHRQEALKLAPIQPQGEPPRRSRRRVARSSRDSPDLAA